MQVRVKEFHWHHIPSGESGVSEFNKTHAEESLSPWFDEGITESAALYLMNKWNQSKDYKYWF